ncbi:MAG: hypothetical protein IKI84_14570 [Clostridia bacterium]|nr:hypothetical protein [Clostridia bacterium]
MVNLIRMDLYRMRKSKAFIVCLILAFVLALSSAPLEKVLFMVAKSLSNEINETFITEVNFSRILTNPFPMMGMMITLLSLCYFFYADVENGYVKNIAGQMPLKGFTVLSKFMAAIVHNLIFAAAGIIGNVIGCLIVKKITPDSNLLDSIRILVLKMMLLQSISAILLLMVATLHSKSLGMTLAVLFGMGLTGLFYAGINEGLKPLFGQGTNIANIMPDVVISQYPLDTVKALAVSIGWGGVFLLLAIRVFDRKDVK